MGKRILQIVDTYKWAIGELAMPIIWENQQLDFERLELHPKDLERGVYEKNMPKIRALIEWADVIDVQYWRVLSQLAEKIPEIKDKKIILTHHNEKNLLSADWSYVDLHVAKTKYSEKTLSEKYPEKVRLVYNTYDSDSFQYLSPKERPEKVVGYVGRIVAWKGLKEIAQACYELGYPLMIMGKQDDPSYFETIPQEHRDNMLWDYFNCEKEERPDYFKHISCYVGFSRDGREVGPLGLLEAMGSGVPCVTTRAGIAKDICVDEENALLVDFDDVEGLKDAIKNVMENEGLQNKLSKGGWETVKGFNHWRHAMQYRKLYYELLFDDELVSVIIPATYEREIQVRSILNAIENQTYKNVEAIVVWDEVGLLDWKDFTEFSFPIQQIITQQEGYNLGMARNIGAIEANGIYLLFNDSRLLPNHNAIEQFLTFMKSGKLWLFGEKGGNKSNFVENFSFIRRKDYIEAGMCSERMNRYGGLSQELRSRFQAQGFKLEYVPSAQATQMLSSSTTGKHQDILLSKNILWKMGL